MESPQKSLQFKDQNDHKKLHKSKVHICIMVSYTISSFPPPPKNMQLFMIFTVFLSFCYMDTHTYTYTYYVIHVVLLHVQLMIF